MAHISLFPGNREIVEIEEEEPNPGEHYRNNLHKNSELIREEKDRRSLASNAGRISSLEEDLNQLFEIFNRRASSHGLSPLNQAGTSKKNSSKKAMKSGESYSPGHGISERVNLKQALRGLCLSQAAEMAATKRSAKAGRSSEAGRITTMYRNVVVEDSTSDHVQNDGRGGLLEISLVPEETPFDSFPSYAESSPASDLWPSNRSSLAERGAGSREYGRQKLKPQKPASVMSCPSSPSLFSNLPNKGRSVPTQSRMTIASPEFGKQSSADEMSQNQKPTYLPSSSSPSAINNTREVGKSSVIESEKFSAFPEESLHKNNHVSPNASPLSYGKRSLEPAIKIPSQNETKPVSVGVGSHMSKADVLLKEENARSPRRAGLSDKAQEHSRNAITEGGKFSTSAHFGGQSSPNVSFQEEKPSLVLMRRMPEQKEISQLSVGVGNQAKVDRLRKEGNSSVCSPGHPNLGEEASDNSKSNVGPNKLLSKEPAEKSAKHEVKDSGVGAAQKDSLKTVASIGSPKGKKSSKSRTPHHFVKPLIKTRNFVRRKSKKNTASDKSSKNRRSEFTNDLYSSPHPIVCPRCQCVVTDTWKEANQDSPVSPQDSPVSHQESLASHLDSPVYYEDSPVSPFANLSAEVSSGNVASDVSTPGPNSDNSNKSKAVVVAEAKSSSKSKGEFTQSSKGSPGECSSSTSGSEESNLSRPSFCDRPHMSKDVRWEAIRHVRFQQGIIGLRHFNLLKKLGCGDIGTVYLAELIGTNCLFAIKVMDNEFLVRRKKIARAQTEKDILRMLDHPFLPTLYCQFTSDNLSCLVMEYCPGGDLHVLRQRQPGRCFTEQAARFYLAEVLLALEYLHMLGVVYRDLKPENILVREDGHIMLSDFDLSLRCAVSPTLVSSSVSETPRKNSGPCVDTRCAQPLCIEPSCRVTCFTPRLLAAPSKLRKQRSDVAAEMRPLLQLVAEPTSARSNSFVGTHEYLAPEIIKGEGHGSAVDWWTFGIFLFELLYGRTPFKGTGNEETLANVVLQSLKFPDSPLVSLQARDLIAALLVKEPETRLGTERGAAEIKQHPFFDGLNWALIRCAVPPELPELRSYGVPVASSNDKYSSGSGEHLEFEVF